MKKSLVKWVGAFEVPFARVALTQIKINPNFQENIEQEKISVALSECSFGSLWIIVVWTQVIY